MDLLPPDVFTLICDFLEPRERVNLACLSRSMNDLAKESGFMRVVAFDGRFLTGADLLERAMRHRCSLRQIRVTNFADSKKWLPRWFHDKLA